MNINFLTLDYLYRKFRSVVYLVITIFIFPFQGIKFKKANLKIDRKISRISVINKLIKKINNQDLNYLEIGCDLDQTFSQIDLKNKFGVDPTRGGNIRKTSDNFFKDNTEEFDIVFIDGSHLIENVHNDVINSLKFLKEGGYILLDDVLPVYELFTLRRRVTLKSHQDAYKIIFLLNQIKNLEFYYLPHDHGLGLIKMNKKLNDFNFNINYHDFTFSDYLENLEKIEVININEM
jgi:hypothetical protein